jgi:hypothetical protein
MSAHNLQTLREQTDYPYNPIHFERYARFIESRPVRAFKKGFDLNRHHIHPFCYGSSENYIDEPENIIVLTDREHLSLILYYGKRLAVRWPKPCIGFYDHAINKTPSIV